MDFRRITTSTTVSGFAWEGWTHAGLSRRVVVFALRPRRWIVQIDGIAQEIPEAERATLTREESSWGYTDGFIARTRAAAMRVAEAAYSAILRADYAAAEASGFADDREAGAKAGAAFAADTMALPSNDLQRRERVRMARRGSDYLRLAANAHCGVFAPEARKHAFISAWRAAWQETVFRISEARQAARAAEHAANMTADMPDATDPVWSDRDAQIARIAAREPVEQRANETAEEYAARHAGARAGLRFRVAKHARQAPEMYLSEDAGADRAAYLEALDSGHCRASFIAAFHRAAKESGQ